MLKFSKEIFLFNCLPALPLAVQVRPHRRRPAAVVLVVAVPLVQPVPGRPGHGPRPVAPVAVVRVPVGRPRSSLPAAATPRGRGRGRRRVLRVAADGGGSHPGPGIMVGKNESLDSAQSLLVDSQASYSVKSV